MNDPIHTPSPSGTIRRTLRNLTKHDPLCDTDGRSYRVAVEIEPSTNGPETVTLRIKLSSTDGASFSTGSAIACPRDTLKSHMSALIEEAGVQGFVLAESKDTLRQRAKDFLTENPIKKPAPIVKEAVIKERVAKPPRIRNPRPEKPKPAPKPVKKLLPSEVPEEMQPFYKCLEKIKGQEPRIQNLSLCVDDESNSCTFHIRFVPTQGTTPKTESFSFKNAVIHSSINGRIVKPHMMENILATIQCVMGIPANTASEMIASGNRPLFYQGR
jgi:hypothetical protein